MFAFLCFDQETFNDWQTLIPEEGFKSPRPGATDGF